MSEIIHLKFPFDLKKDQSDAVDEWINRKGKGSIIYSTGTGKTEIAFECARKMAFLADEDMNVDEKPRFKMDANGNLERVDFR